MAMKEFSWSKKLLNRYKFSLFLLIILALADMVIWLYTGAPESSKWLMVSMEAVALTSFFISIVSYVINIREPAIKTDNEKFKVKIDGSINYWETTWENLSHVEIRVRRVNGVLRERYEFVRFKQPVVRTINIFGVEWWKASRKGFRLEFFDKNARREIKSRLPRHTSTPSHADVLNISPASK